MSATFVFRNIRGGLFALALLAPSVAGAWGPQGHRLVAALAWEQLTPQVKTQIEALLRDEPDPSLPGIANWADQLRSIDPELGRRSAAWHYVNIGGDDCGFNQPLDCPQGHCVVDAIAAQTRLLADASQAEALRTQALKFVVHFIGDIHQPLHAGHAADKGGNTVQINFQNKGSNLHRLWDSGLLNKAKLDDDRFLKRLRKLPVPGPSPSSPSAAVDHAAQWAERSCSIVRKPGFYPPRARVPDDYVQTWRPVAEAQLRLASVNLAAVLNQALDDP